MPYDGLPASERGGIAALLDGMQKQLGWVPIMDGANIIGLHDETDGGAISLEPGGQFELSGAALATIHATAAEIEAHFAVLKPVADPLGIGFLATRHDALNGGSTKCRKCRSSAMRSCRNICRGSAAAAST